MFGHNEKPKGDEDKSTETAEAAVKDTLEALEKGLAAKRTAREKTAQLIGSLRPLVKST